MTGTSAHKILIVQTGGARDFFKSLAETAALCHRHKDAHKTFLTRKPLADMAQRSRCFDAVMVKQAAAFYHVPGRLAHLAALRREKFTHVYAYAPLSFAERTALNGAQIIYGAADMAAALAKDGIEVTPPDTGWLQSDVSLFGLRKPYVLLLPGPEAGGWPSVRYAAAALKLIREGYDVALLGTDAEAARLAKIHRGAAEAKDIGGRTSFYDIASLARDAAGVIGAQSGAVQLAALVGAPVVAFLQSHENPETDAPYGTAVTVIQADDMADVTVEDVLKNLRIRSPAARGGAA